MVDRSSSSEESSDDAAIEYAAGAEVTFLILKSVTAGVIADFGFSFLNPKLKLAGWNVAVTDAAESTLIRPAPAVNASAMSILFEFANTGAAELISADLI